MVNFKHAAQRESGRESVREGRKRRVQRRIDRPRGGKYKLLRTSNKGKAVGEQEQLTLCIYGERTRSHKGLRRGHDATAFQEITAFIRPPVSVPFSAFSSAPRTVLADAAMGTNYAAPATPTAVGAVSDAWLQSFVPAVGEGCTDAEFRTEPVGSQQESTHLSKADSFAQTRKQ